LYDAAWAIREAMKVCQEAEDMLAAGAIGEVLGETLTHAKELLDIADRELAEVDPHRFRVLVAAAPVLRAKLRVLRDRAK
jgi:hypothetical protein